MASFHANDAVGIGKVDLVADFQEHIPGAAGHEKIDDVDNRALHCGFVGKHLGLLPVEQAEDNDHPGPVTRRYHLLQPLLIVGLYRTIRAKARGLPWLIPTVTLRAAS